MKPFNKSLALWGFCLVLFSQTAIANTTEKPIAESKIRVTPKYEFRVKAGANIGGSAPINMPVEIRELRSYNPTLALSLEANIRRMISPKWGIQTGLRFETKAMQTNAGVKNYMMRLSQGDQTIQGVFTGGVITKVKNEYLTIPLLLTRNLSPRWNIQMGCFASFLLNGNFSGIAYDGYIRDEKPTNPKMSITEAPYDFSSEIRKFNTGLEFGGEYKVYKHFSVYADLTWSLNSIFSKDFTAVTFSMYNIYLNMGFSYLF